MPLVHVCLDLEHEARKLVARGVDGLAREDVGVWQGRGRETQEVLEEGLHAKVGERRPKEHRGQTPVPDRIEVELVVGAIQQLNVVNQRAVVLLANELVELGVAQLRLDLAHALGGVGVAVALKGNYMARVAVEDATEVATTPNGPGHGVGPNAQDVLDFLHQVEGVARIVVELVHEGEDGDVTQRADLEQLDGLCLDALGTVDHHDCGVGRHEGAVGVLREVLVTRGVQDVDAGTVVGELQHRRRDRDAALLLDVHPVRDRML